MRLRLSSAVRCRRFQFFETAIDNRGIGERRHAACYHFLDGPLIARLAELVRYLAQLRFIVAHQRPANMLVPALGRAQRNASKLVSGEW